MSDIEYYHQLEKENEKLREENAHQTLRIFQLESDLSNIANPIHELEKQKLPVAVVYQLADSPSYLKDLARKALLQKGETNE